jgi:hypothetical protein
MQKFFIFGVLYSKSMCRRVLDWYRERPTERILFTIATIMTMLFILFLTTSWALGINAQFRGLIINASASSSEGYTPEFEKNLTAFSNTIKEYGAISLSLFGITFLGGIFDLRRDITREGTFSRITTTMVFTISIVFLFCFMTLHLLYTISYPYLQSDANTILLLMNIGLSLFIIAVNLLLFLLILFLMTLILSPRTPSSSNNEG